MFSEESLKQIIPATPGWYVVWKDKTGYEGVLIAAWGRFKTIVKDEDEEYIEENNVLPLVFLEHGQEEMCTPKSILSGRYWVVFRPHWFRQSNSHYVNISKFDEDLNIVVSD